MMLSFDKDLKALKELRNQIDSLMELSADDVAYVQWRTHVQTLLKRCIDSECSQQFSRTKAKTHLGEMNSKNLLGKKCVENEQFKKTLALQRAKLDGWIADLESQRTENPADVFKKLAFQALELRDKVCANDEYKDWYKEIENAFVFYNISSSQRKDFYSQISYDFDIPWFQDATYSSMLNKASCLLQHIAEIYEEAATSKSVLQKTSQKQPKIFISHCEKDAEAAGLLIDLLHDMGIPNTGTPSIFCSSIAGMDIPLRERIFSYIKKEFDCNDLYVIMMLSENYYESAPCLNEMGASWVLDCKRCSILLPGFSFNQLKGVVDKDIMAISLGGKDLWKPLNKLRKDLHAFMGFPLTNNDFWEEKRNKFIEKIKSYYSEEAEVKIFQEEKDEQKTICHKFDEKENSIIKFLKTANNQESTISQIANAVKIEPIRLIKILKHMVAKDILIRNDCTRNSRWQLAPSFIERIKKLEARPDFSKTTEWTP